MAATQIKQQLMKYVKKTDDWIETFNLLSQKAEEKHLPIHEYFETYILDTPKPKKEKKKKLKPIPDPVEVIIKENPPIEEEIFVVAVEAPEEDDGSVKTLPCPYPNCDKIYTQQHHYDKHIETKHAGEQLNGE